MLGEPMHGAIDLELAKVRPRPQSTGTVRVAWRRLIIPPHIISHHTAQTNEFKQPDYTYLGGALPLIMAIAGPRETHDYYRDYMT